MRKNCSRDQEKLLEFETDFFEINGTIYSNSEKSELQEKKEKKWYFVAKIVLTYREKKLF